MADEANLERLKIALFQGRHVDVQSILSEHPRIARDSPAIAAALYDIAALREALDADAELINRAHLGPRSLILHLSFSRHLHGGGNIADCLECAKYLLEVGADPNDGFLSHPGSDDRLTALYGAIGHADNIPLGRLLLEAGANPDDNESLYHSTELSHSEGLKLLLQFDANPRGTNALLRAIDFDDVEKVDLLLAAGADPCEGDGRLIPALHHAARRFAGPAMVQALIAAGAEPDQQFQGLTAYGLARAFGSRGVAVALVEAGASTEMSEAVNELAELADGARGDPTKAEISELPFELRTILTQIADRPQSLDHIKRLVEFGFSPDFSDETQMPAFHVAGWTGNAELLRYFLKLNPDLERRNGYGGKLVSTILHGAENARPAEWRDYERCLSDALQAGARFSLNETRSIHPELSALIADYAQRHPEQVDP